MPKKKKTEVVEEKMVCELAGDGSKAVTVAIKQLKKQFGDDVIDWLGSRQQEPHSVIPTGSFGLDAALGVGGFVKGRIYELYGPHSSGKTTLALSAIREAQKMGGYAAYVDAEHTLDPDLLRKMEIDLDKIVIVQGYTGEDNLDLAKTLIGTSQFDLCVIDSVSALQPAAEANLGSFSDNTMGLHPRLMSRMSRDLTPRVSRSKTALLLINQIRANMGGYGNPETTSGGNALQHHVSGKIRVSGGAVKSRQLKNKQGDVIGHRVTFEVTKNKLAPPFRSADVDLIYGSGFNKVGELIDLGVDMGFVDKAGSWYSYGDTKLGQGREASIALLAENDEIREKLAAEVKMLLGFGE